MRVAVIGTGIMGVGMAGSLAREGHDVVVWNRSRDKAEATGLEVAESVGDAVTGADAVVTILFDADAVLAQTADIAGALGEGAVWLQASTVGPAGMGRIAEAAGAARGRLLDAPVLGTRKPAQEGALTVLVSGAEAARDQAGPVLAAIGARTVVAGDEIGAASALKLACNSWVGLITAGTAQALALAQAQGVEPGLFLEAIEGGAVDSTYAHVKGGAMLKESYDDVSFQVDGVRKDTRLMIDAAREAGMATPLLEAVVGLFDVASERGHGGEDMAAVRAAF
ncbi:NAD(P)-dependent oxidoreductase [Nocardioides mangrovicus]|uniref:NAD(P)-dependent oxidoreductase n=1 Tax=Nocardioides mangrovicus TaxID=2478913 RepID=A0A3L8P2T9_9ACTN|nr:NAD(P)-dependent oxidoreductase [Nocardioides mangrovicus]RLV48738.1 NAD(P)-dependent oxidoreductase [Nocardioides mangrovicus]